MNINTYRPGVYADYTLSAVTGSGMSNLGLMAIAAPADKGTALEITTVTSKSMAIDTFGPDCNLTRLISAALDNAPLPVMAIPVIIGKSAALTNYKAAFDALALHEGISVIVTDSEAEGVQSVLKASIDNTRFDRFGYRMGVVHLTGDISALCARAKKLNSERIVLAENLDGVSAAALGARLAAVTDPAVPLNGEILKGVTGEDRLLTDEELTALITAGVTPLETLSGVTQIVRAVTTKTFNSSGSDTTFREVNTVLIADRVVTDVKNSLSAMFTRAKNTAQTRGAIRTQVVVELEKKLKAQIIDGYGNVTAKQDDTDPTVCDVAFNFTVTHGINSIVLTAYITV